MARTERLLASILSNTSKFATSAGILRPSRIPLKPPGAASLQNENINDKTMTDQPDPETVLRGGKTITVSGVSEGQPFTEDVFVREVTYEDVLEGPYLDKLRTSYRGCLEWLMDKPDGWARTLDRDSWRRLRETEEAVNFEFALAEAKAAHERGQKLKFIDDRILAESQKMLSLMNSFSRSSSSPGFKKSSVPTHLRKPRAG